MADPVFTTREELESWAKKRHNAAFVKAMLSRRAGRYRATINDEAAKIGRVVKAHAHLLTPESDNG